MRFLRALRRLLRRPRHDRPSYSQCGEDLIIAFAFQALGVARPTYFDIGAHHPVAGSNTYLFYRTGSRGVCIEPNPAFSRLFRRHRPRDTILNRGVSAAPGGPAPFYLMSATTLSTFDPATAAAYTAMGSHRLQETLLIPQLPISELCALHGCPDLLSMDVEGLDLELLRACDWSSWQPKVCCIETLTYTEDRSEEKRRDILDLMCANGYFVYADTWINTIFVLGKAWKAR